MSQLFAPVTSRLTDIFYLLFRILVGFMFLSHGAQKLGLLEGGFQIQGFMGFIGICELVGGAAILLGFLTRLAALLAAVIMIGAYVQVHMPNGILPLANKGELALLYLSSFLVLFAFGGRRWTLDTLLMKKEVF